MTGHDAIVALRRRGLRPVCVWVSDYPCDTSDSATVSLSSADVPELQDWRFVVGLTVLVDGDDASRVARIAAACKAFAKRVVATVYSPAQNYLGRSRMAVASITDTQGALTWPSC